MVPEFKKQKKMIILFFGNNESKGIVVLVQDL